MFMPSLSSQRYHWKLGELEGLKGQSGILMPSEASGPVSSDKQTEKAEEERLIEEAEKTAAATHAVEKDTRKKRSGKAASQRIKSEAETRYLKDEQLRKIGWEADTELLRYSKGARPAKGRNIAIAEWSTDSTVGNKGYVDYALFVDTQMVATIEAKAIHKDTVLGLRPVQRSLTKKRAIICAMNGGSRRGSDH